MNIYPEQITIEVTQEDIDNGKPTWCNAFPVALALKHKYHPTALENLSVFVDQNTIQIFIHDPYSESKGIFYDLPLEAIQFIENFDNGEDVKPFSFKATLNKEQYELTQ